jgi:hypothetical protein
VANIIRPNTFLFLRTKLAIEHETAAIEGLSAHFPYSLCHAAAPDLAKTEFAVHVFGFGEDRLTFSNGLVIQFTTHHALSKIVEGMKAGLDNFEAWSMCKFNGRDYKENTAGQMDQFFYQTGAPAFATVFILSQDDNPHHQQNIEGFREAYQTHCLPVFYFQHGQIMFVATNEPATIIQRQQDKYLKHFDDWAILDSQQQSIQSSSSADIWELEYLSEIEFTDD